MRVTVALVGAGEGVCLFVAEGLLSLSLSLSLSLLPFPCGLCYLCTGTQALYVLCCHILDSKTNTMQLKSYVDPV
jgi:hypothetical protein